MIYHYEKTLETGVKNKCFTTWPVDDFRKLQKGNWKRKHLNIWVLGERYDTSRTPNRAIKP